MNQFDQTSTGHDIKLYHLSATTTEPYHTILVLEKQTGLKFGTLLEKFSRPKFGMFLEKLSSPKFGMFLEKSKAHY